MSIDSKDHRRSPNGNGGDGDGTDDGTERKRGDKNERKLIDGLTPRVPGNLSNVNPTNERIYKWLEGLMLLADGWADRIRVCAAYGTGGMRQGPILRELNFSKIHRPTTENCVEWANLILLLCEEDCDALNKQTTYQACAYNALTSDRSYSRIAFGPLKPSGVLPAHVEERAIEEEEDNGVVKDDLLRELYVDRRFHMTHAARMYDQHQQAMDGILSRYEARLSAAETVNRELLNVHLRLIELKEQLADKAATRALQERKQLFWQEKIEKLVDVGTAFLPGLVAHVTGGKSTGDAIKAFVLGLDEAQSVALLGEWSDGRRVGDAILTEDQCITLKNMVDGLATSADVSVFEKSLRADQLVAAQAILRPGQIAGLLAIVESLKSNARNGTANGAAS